MSFLNPTIDKAYEAHDKASKGPLDSLAVIANSLNLNDSRDPADFIDPLRTSLDARLQTYDEAGIDARTVLAASYMINILTEDNLPHYTTAISKVAQHSESLTGWLNRWTAEEASHGLLMRDYALYSGLMGSKSAVLDYQQYQVGRNSQLSTGTEIQIGELSGGLAYVTLQEDATYEAHKREAKLFDEHGKTILEKIASDEARHQNAYGSMEAALLDEMPDQTIIAIQKRFARFEMPGKKGIPNFDNMALTVAVSGLFDPALINRLQQKHINSKKWNIAERRPVTDEGKKAQEKLLKPNPILTRLQKIVDQEKEKRLQNAHSHNNKLPLILGVTVNEKTGMPINF